MAYQNALLFGERKPDLYPTIGRRRGLTRKFVNSHEFSIVGVEIEFFYIYIYILRMYECRGVVRWNEISLFTRQNFFFLIHLWRTLPRNGVETYGKPNSRVENAGIFLLSILKLIITWFFFLVETRFDYRARIIRIWLKGVRFQFWIINNEALTVLSRLDG